MGPLQWAETKTQAMSIWDIGMIKWCCVLAGMIAGAYLSAFVIQHVVWFGIAVCLLFLILIVRVFLTKKS